jgi:hypothetical protein
MLQNITHYLTEVAAAVAVDRGENVESIILYQS